MCTLWDFIDPWRDEFQPKAGIRPPFRGRCIKIPSSKNCGDLLYTFTVSVVQTPGPRSGALPAPKQKYYRSHEFRYREIRAEGINLSIAKKENTKTNGKAGISILKP